MVIFFRMSDNAFLDILMLLAKRLVRLFFIPLLFFAPNPSILQMLANLPSPYTTPTSLINATSQVAVSASSCDASRALRVLLALGPKTPSLNPRMDLVLDASSRGGSCLDIAGMATFCLLVVLGVVVVRQR